MLSVQEAETIIFNLVQVLDPRKDVEKVDISSALGRILAEPVIGNLDFPHWDNSAMDGYAVRWEDVEQARDDKPVDLEIIGEIPAGYPPKLRLQPGEAARIFTGAVMPDDADTVVMQEVTRREENRVWIQAAPSKCQAFVRKQGAYYQAGQELLPAGIVIQGTEIAILAALQVKSISVYRKLKVAIFSTGDELVTVGQTLQPGQIVDSNQNAIASLLKQLGVEVVILGIVPDQAGDLEVAVKNAISSDIVISSGGVSVGEYDYVEDVLTSLGAKVHVESVAMKPGKPLTVATLKNLQNQQVLYFGLPGNPVSALVTFWRFVQPMIKKLSGLSDGWQPIFIKAKARQELRCDGKRESYVWGKLRLVDGFYEFDVAGGSQVSGNLINLAQTNGLAVLNCGQTLISPGELLKVLLVQNIC
ncbi:gephyrin-like molybdotransferase Glp [Calothrix sp. PCC 6303]|uniref:molybdopterin molybdotransferase MoeA n=1 Tax=Calothrix sp. PCC 6303 TaxID=1170562 RepID=UPI0002A03F26|nr:gephyrin-like molybdotransferase Glp [Calothrix sp. PCC 6303]AFY99114.1 molybdopterin molybdochelatase [Calothrix sp. PCC 6303]